MLDTPAGLQIPSLLPVFHNVNSAGVLPCPSRRELADEIWVIDCSPEGHQPDVPTRIFTGAQQLVCITIAVRYGASKPDTPATVRFASVAGSREGKFATLASVDLDGSGWAECGTKWCAPFVPAAADGWSALPALDDLLAWSGSGTMPGRTWVVAPSPAVLKERRKTLIAAKKEDGKRGLLAEHPVERTVHTRLTDNLPGYEPAGRTIADETDACVQPVRHAYRSFDRQWIIPDKRVINQPNPSLWQEREAPGQLFLTGLQVHAPSKGPALTACALVPDLHHFRGSFGGRAWPLWLDAAGTRPNVVPGLLEALASRYQRAVSGPDVFADIAALVASPAYVDRFSSELLTPGLRIPLTADASLFAETADLGRRVLWLDSFGERFVNAAQGRPPGAPRLPQGERLLVTATIPDTAAGLPETIDYDAVTRTLSVGLGSVAPVDPAVWGYEVSGMKVVKRWLDRRKKQPDGRRSSPLDDVVPQTWEPAWTTELLEVLNVLALLVALEPEQKSLLDRVLSGPLSSTADLTATGVIPAQNRPISEKPQKAGQLLA